MMNEAMDAPGFEPGVSPNLEKQDFTYLISQRSAIPDFATRPILNKKHLFLIKLTL